MIMNRKEYQKDRHKNWMLPAIVGVICMDSRGLKMSIGRDHQDVSRSLSYQNIDAMVARAVCRSSFKLPLGRSCIGIDIDQTAIISAAPFLSNEFSRQCCKCSPNPSDFMGLLIDMTAVSLSRSIDLSLVSEQIHHRTSIRREGRVTVCSTIR
jgi:hypothetical protein